jgi:hypothetical protein
LGPTGRDHAVLRHEIMSSPSALLDEPALPL